MEWQNTMIRFFGAEWYSRTYTHGDLGKLAQEIVNLEAKLAEADSMIEKYTGAIALMFELQDELRIAKDELIKQCHCQYGFEGHTLVTKCSCCEALEKIRAR